MKSGSVKILLVEDAAPDVFLVRQALRVSGLPFQLEVLEDGEKAIERIKALDSNTSLACPDLMLLDLNLPMKSGDQVLQFVRQSQRCGQMPVVVVTSSDSPRDRSRVALLGATHYFQKPSKLDDFMKLGDVVKSIAHRANGNSA